jgi:Zn-dependent protease with chaperone function
MDFFERQEAAQKATKRIVILYVTFVILLALSIHLAVSLLLFLGSETDTGFSLNKSVFLNFFTDPLLLLLSFGITFSIIAIATAYKNFNLRQGGAAVALSLGAREVNPGTLNYREKRLLNVIEEIALASGVPAPRVFIMDDEPGINAFAAGYSPNDAAIAVTQGALLYFNREELQAVIGHEFSHILNGDMRLNIKLIGVLFGILCISIIGSLIVRLAPRMTTRSRGRRSKNSNAGVVVLIFAFGAMVWLIGSIGVLCGRIIQAMISRQREKLADASSIQFTRNPNAMANALKIIGACSHGGTVNNVHASEISHMFFTSAFSKQLFATHPPVLERIQSIDSSFDGDYTATRKLMVQRLKRQEKKEEENEEENLIHRGAIARTILRNADSLLGTEEADSYSGEQTSKPEKSPLPDMQSAIQEQILASGGATACLLASLISSEQSIRDIQIGIVREGYGDEIIQQIEQMDGYLRTLNAPEKRYVCETAVNTLRVLPNRDISILLAHLEKLVYADAQVDAFEFASLRLFKSRLMPDVIRSRAKIQAPGQLAKDASYVLRVLANFGTPDADEARNAWSAGATSLESSFGAMVYDKQAHFNDLKRFDTALLNLVNLSPVAKRDFIEACKAVVTFDQQITDTEYYFLYAIADVIEVTGWKLGE